MEPGTPTDQPRPRPRSAQKRRAVLDAARHLFLEHGYAGTSVDDISSSAEVSKPTVYAHFVDKGGLFSAVVTDAVDRTADMNTPEIDALAGAGDLAAALEQLAHHQLQRVIHAEMLQLRRLVIAESSRFPELGRLFYERGPGRTIGALAESFGRLDDADRLHAPDAWAAARHFNWLVMSDPINRAMLLGDDAVPNAIDLTAHVGEAVRVFLAAYAAG